VVDESNRLLGTVTDGDIRRGILRGVPMSESVVRIMNRNPRTAARNEGPTRILQWMKEHLLHHIPVLDEKGCVVGIELLDELIQSRPKENWVVIMAGGLGDRLKPLTADCPKPLLKVGTKPILETILENFLEYGLRHFFLSVNYKEEMVREYFGDGSRWNVSIEYLQEEERMGTAGALGLLLEKPAQPLIVMNGDVLTKVNFQHLLDFHLEQKAVATMAVREYDFQVPFGVVKIEGQSIVNIDEKPLQRFFVNAGIYVLEPQALEWIPKKTYLDMPHLFNQLAKARAKTIAFPIREYWLDVGLLQNYEKAQVDSADGKISG
jgi:NDP-sugar pyrophosphorylase family protein